MGKLNLIKVIKVYRIHLFRIKNNAVEHDNKTPNYIQGNGNTSKDKS